MISVILDTSQMKEWINGPNLYNIYYGPSEMGAQKLVYNIFILWASFGTTYLLFVRIFPFLVFTSEHLKIIGIQLNTLKYSFSESSNYKDIDGL